MYYWSRWANIPTTEKRADEMQEAQSSWRDTAPRLAAQRDTRPVVVVTRNRTQPLAAPVSYQRRRIQERATTSGISLDVHRSSHAFRSDTHTCTPTGCIHDATTQPMLAALRVK